ncbi:U3 small nucleolar ribonucleoprotein subunit [Entamoeba marina]
MVRKLKYHESKLLKKVEFIDWKRDGGIRQSKILARFHIHDPKEYQAYNKVTLLTRKLSSMLSKLPKDDAFRMVLTKRICDRLYELGVVNLPEKGLRMLDILNASAFCRRRLAIMVKNNKMANHVEMAETLIQHERLGEFKGQQDDYDLGGMD